MHIVNEQEVMNKAQEFPLTYSILQAHKASKCFFDWANELSEELSGLFEIFNADTDEPSPDMVLAAISAELWISGRKYISSNKKIIKNLNSMLLIIPMISSNKYFGKILGKGLYTFDDEYKKDFTKINICLNPDLTDEETKMLEIALGDG